MEGMSSPRLPGPHFDFLGSTSSVAEDILEEQALQPPSLSIQIEKGKITGPHFSLDVLPGDED